MVGLHSDNTDCDAEHGNQETHNTRAQQVFQKELLRRTALKSTHHNFIGDNLDTKLETTGTRIATHNFNKKLYGEEANIDSILKFMATEHTNILVAQEPGLPSRHNTTRLLNVVRRHGYDAKFISRHHNASHGGLVIIMDQQWSKIPCKVREYRPDKDRPCRTRLNHPTARDAPSWVQNEVRREGA